MNKRLMLWTAVLVVVNLATLLVFLPVLRSRDDGVGIDIPVSRVDIKLEGVYLENIKNWSKDEIYAGNQMIISNNEKKLALDNVSIGGRGNSTWYQDKIPFRIKLDERENLFGLGKNKKWNLLANQFDDTHLRNEVGFGFWNMMGDDVLMREEPVSLYIDGEYEGLYYLVPKIEISKSLVDIRGENGILVELDNLNGEEEECHETKMGNCMIVEDVLNWNNEEDAMGIFMEKFNKFEEASEQGDWGFLEELCDIDSFARYFLVSEFSSNPDAYSSSYFFYLDGEKDKIHVGPAWDFDFAFDNERWGWGILDRSPESRMVIKDRVFEPNSSISKMIFYMMEMPIFRERVRIIVQDRLEGRKDELLGKIIERRDQIRDEAIRNNEKWDRMDFDEESEKLSEWVSRRYDFIEKEYGGYGDTGAKVKQT